MESRKNRLFKELITVSEEIARDGSQVADKRSWLSLEVSDYGTHWQQNGMLFTGNAGIGLFFNELHAFTKDETFLEVARQAMNWVEAYLKTCKVNHPAFYIGNGGIAYVYLRLYQTTMNDQYRDLALSLLRGKSNQVSDKELLPDLLSGHAGIVIGLIYAHAVTKEPDLLDQLSVHVFHLLDAALADHAGLKWGYKEKNINSLCGISHGASGIGYAFVLLARYFNNDAFLSIASQAFAFERQYYSTRSNNWLDLRLLESPEKALDAFRSSDLSYFFEGSDSNSWSHGAAGIGMVRLRAHHIHKSEAWLKEGMLAIDKCIATDISGHHKRNFSLSSGKAGVAELFLEAYRVLGKREYLDYAFRIAEEATALRLKTGQYPVGFKDSKYDNGLFMGRTGIAYLLLRVLNERETESVLLPGFSTAVTTDHEVKNHLLSRLTKDQLQRYTHRKYLQRSGSRLGVEVSTPDDQTLSFLKRTSHSPAIFKEVHSTTETFKVPVIAQATVALLRENRSYIYSATQDRISEIETRKLRLLTEDQFSQLRLQFNPAVTIVSIDSLPSRGEKINAILLKRKGNAVLEFELNLLSEIIFQHTYAGTTVDVLTRKVMKELSSNTTLLQPTGSEKITQQIRNLVSAGFLDANG